MRLSERDKQYIWHPLTQHYNADAPMPIKSGKGAYLFDHAGNRYLDLISSWWVNIHGHSHPKIAQAIYEQAMTLEQVIFAGFTHEPAINLAEKLLTLLPTGLSKVFYSDNGSTSVEVALKMAYQYWRNQGQSQRKRFMAFNNGYHGETFGSMAVGKTTVYGAHFHDLLFDVDFFTYPDTWMHDAAVVEKEQKSLTEIEAYLIKHPNEVAGLIIEPLVQGASGMRMCRVEFLQQLQILLRQYGVLIIYDEVMTGFGRTGDYFASLKSDTTPDIICLSKGLTGGYLPLAVTACREFIFEAFLGDTFEKTLAHSHSFTANPLGCAAALASLALLTQPETILAIKNIERMHHEELKKLMEIGATEKWRCCGTIAAFDLRSVAEYGSEDSVKWRKRFSEKGLLIRPIGNVIYLLPPYCISEQDLQQAYRMIAEEIQGVFHDAC